MLAVWVEFEENMISDIEVHFSSSSVGLLLYDVVTITQVNLKLFEQCNLICKLFANFMYRAISIMVLWDSKWRAPI